MSITVCLRDYLGAVSFAFFHGDRTLNYATKYLAGWMRAGEGDAAGHPAAKPVFGAETRAGTRAFPPMYSTL